MNKYYQKVKENWIQSLGGKCVECQSQERLEIDHINPKEKSFSLSKVWSQIKYRELILEELKKCQVLCYICHKQKSNEESSIRKLSEGFTHGKEYAWMKKKCGCSLCLQDKETYNVKRRIKRRKSGVVAKLAETHQT